MKRFVVLVLLVVFFATSCSLTGDKNVAVVNGKKISADELYRYIEPANFKALSPEEKQAQVDLVCDDYLAYQYLKDHGDLDSGLVYWEIRVWEIRELANGAYQNLVIDKLLTPKRLKSLYNKMKYEMDVSHLLIGHNESARKLNERSPEEAKALAYELSEKINDDNFTELVMEYSDDGSKENNKGHLGWAQPGKWVESFEDAVYDLKPGDISKPIVTPFGYHIIKLHERREIPVPPFEDAKQDLIDLIYGRSQTEFSQRQYDVFDSLSVANPLVVDSLKLKDFLDRFNRLSQNVFYSQQFTSFDIMDIFDDSLCVGQLGDIKIDKAWIVEYLRMISLQLPPRFTTEASFGGFVEENRIGALLNKAAINLGLDKREDYIKTRKVFLAKKANTLFDKLYVYEMITPTNTELKEFYENHKAELYTVEPRVKVREVLLKSKEEAEKILARAKNGESMAELATNYSIRNVGKNNEGLIPPVKKNQYDEMSLAAFNMKDGELGGPYKIGEHYSVIRRLEYIPESYRDIENISYRLLTDYRTKYMEEKRAEQKNMLRNTYSVRINKSFVE